MAREHPSAAFHLPSAKRLLSAGQAAFRFTWLDFVRIGIGVLGAGYVAKELDRSARGLLNELFELFREPVLGADGPNRR